MKHLFWVPKLRNRVSMQKHRGFQDYNTQVLISFVLPCEENIRLCFWPYLCFKRHAPDITLCFLTYKMKLASSGNTLTATTSRNFCYWFLCCQDFTHSMQNNMKNFSCCFHIRRVSLHGRMQDCADISVLAQVPNAIEINYCTVRPLATCSVLSEKQLA